MEKETQQLNANIEKMLQALEKAQDNIAESIDSLLVQMGEVEASVTELKRLIAKGNTTTPSTINNIDDDTIEDDDDEQPSALEELSDFDADDDLSDDDLKRLGYDM